MLASLHGIDEAGPWFARMQKMRLADSYCAVHTSMHGCITVVIMYVCGRVVVYESSLHVSIAGSMYMCVCNCVSLGVVF